MIGGHYSNDERMDKKTPRQDGKRGKDTERQRGFKATKAHGQDAVPANENETLEKLVIFVISLNFVLSVPCRHRKSTFSCLSAPPMLCNGIS
jgi:hypothetical protein